MKPRQSVDNRPLHQTVAEGFEFKSDGKAIAVGFTDQKLSAHAGSATFWAWLHGTDWRRVLQAQLPHRPPTSNNHLTPLEKALAFTHGLLGAARKLAQVAYLRRDPVLPELLGVRRVASASVLSRFFSGSTRRVARSSSSCRRVRSARTWIFIDVTRSRHLPRDGKVVIMLEELVHVLMSITDEVLVKEVVARLYPRVRWDGTKYVVDAAGGSNP